MLMFVSAKFLSELLKKEGVAFVGMELVFTTDIPLR